MIFSIETRNRLDGSQASLLDTDNFKKILDIMSNKTYFEEMDAGERESILDAFMQDIKFCQANEEQIKLVGISVPKHYSPSAHRDGAAGPLHT